MNEVPFKDVYVHALVRDETGKKMSKSTGNVIDPLSVIERYGTDAFRFTLAAFAAQGRDIKMSEKRIEGYRHFVNKLWNAARLALMHIENAGATIDVERLALPDRWILSRLNAITAAVEEALDTYRFNDAAAALYNFVWHEFCDWYLEAIKPVLYDNEGPDRKAATIAVVGRVLHDTLILLHPFVPFVTEEIWQKLPGTQGSIMRAVFPSDAADFEKIKRDEKVEQEMKLVIDAITGVRNVRGEMDLAPSMALDVTVQSAEDPIRQTIDQYRDLITNLARVKSLAVEPLGEKPATAAIVTKVKEKHNQLLEKLHKLESTLEKIRELAK
jgi:valyl-tRNA synthetase